MFFEGSEKKFELSVVRGTPSLRQLPAETIAECVHQSQAKILSKLSSDHCDAYLLSESSLFVWDDRITMITCGTTTLSKAALFLINALGVNSVESFFFERKNEYFARHQKSDFFEDVQLFKKILPGSAYRLGAPNEHHLYLFHFDRDYDPPANDPVLEVLMYGLSGQAFEIFNTPKMDLEKVHNFLNLEKVFPGFQLDGFVFDPIGYSCNGLLGRDYYTIHVTPQGEGPYVSFETNISERPPQEIIEAVRSIFLPKSFDVIQFNSQPLSPVYFDDLRKINIVEDRLGGYNVMFKSYYSPCQESNRAEKLDI